MDKKDGNILEKKREETKFQNEITEMVNHAEKLAREYNFSLKKAVKKGVIDVECVYPSVIMIYEQVKQKINEKGWNDQLAIYDNQIRYYHELLDRDNKLRDLENQKFQEQKIFNDSQIYAKKAKEELLKLKTQALEVKKRSAMEYESKKDQAFNFMDLAKKELKQNNFEKAISYYIESEKIFAEIKWPEGIRMIKDSINVIKLKKERIEREAKLTELKTREKLKLEAQIPFMIIRSNHLQDLQQEHRRRELLRIEEEKERVREISEKAFSYLEEGTALKNKKKFEEAYEKYILGRDMFKKIGWEHEASRINNDLLIMLKKEMNQASRLKFYQQRIIQEKLELEELLRDADENQKELDKRRKLEKRKQREKLIQKELDSVNDIVKMLKYNEAVLGLRKIIKKIENTNLDNLKKDINDQIEVLLNASQVPIITNFDLERDENLNSFKLAYQALDKAQISLLNNAFFRAITELNEALFNLKETKIGIRFISAIEGKIITYKKELDIKETPEQKIKAPKIETDDIRKKFGIMSVTGKNRIENFLEETQTEEQEAKMGNKERILKLLESNALTSKEIADKLNLSEKNTRTYLLRLKKEDKIKPISKKGRFSIYTLQRPPISRNQYNEIGALENDLNYLLNLMEKKMSPKDGVKFTPTDLMNIKRIEERIADKIGGNLKAREAIKDLIDFEQSFKEEINEKITRLEKKVDFIASRNVKSKKDKLTGLKTPYWLDKVLMAEEYDYLFKSIVVGDGGVGKKALTDRFSKGFFTEDYKMTIGVDYHVKTISIDTSEGPIKCKLQLWDTGGQERFSSIRPMYYRGSLGTILVFDLTNSASFKHLPQWIEEVRANIKTEIPVLLVGNKSDLIDQRAVSIEEISKFTKDFNLYYMETSAKTGEGVEECFYFLACLMIGQGVPDHIIAKANLYAPGEVLKIGGQNSTPVTPLNKPQEAYAAPLVPEATEIEFRTPNEILKKVAAKSGLETLSSDGNVYKTKAVPFTYFPRKPITPPTEFQPLPSEKTIIDYDRPGPFGILKREEPSKPEPIFGIYGPTPKPQSEMTGISPFFQAAESSGVTKKEKKRMTKEKKKRDKEKVRSRRSAKLEKFLDKCTDISIINDVIVIDTKSGIDIFSQSFGGRKLDTSLISGFLQAISNFGSTISEAVRESRTLTIEYKDSIVMQTDFVNLKLIVTLKENPSPNFKFIMEDLAYDIYKQYGEEIDKFTGILKPFENMSELVEKHLNTSFLYRLKIAENPKIKLNMSEKEMISNARTFMKENNFDYFYSLYLMPENISTPKTYQTIFNLIEKGIFQPTEE